MRRDRGDDALHVPAHRREIDDRRRRLDAEPPAGSDCVRGMRGGEQRLRRDAAGVEALAAHFAALDQCRAHAELGRDRRDRKPGRAGADHAQVEAVVAAQSAAPSRSGSSARLLISRSGSPGRCSRGWP